jgi:hypothetical protein
LDYALQERTVFADRRVPEEERLLVESLENEHLGVRQGFPGGRPATSASAGAYGKE